MLEPDGVEGLHDARPGETPRGVLAGGQAAEVGDPAGGGIRVHRVDHDLAGDRVGGGRASGLRQGTASRTTSPKRAASATVIAWAAGPMSFAMAASEAAAGIAERDLVAAPTSSRPLFRQSSLRR